MNRTQARREAEALAAEWIDVWLRTDNGWREAYTEAEQIKVREELKRIRDRLEEAGPSAFFRQREAARSATDQTTKPQPSRIRLEDLSRSDINLLRVTGRSKGAGLHLPSGIVIPDEDTWQCLLLEAREVHGW